VTTITGFRDGHVNQIGPIRVKTQALTGKRKLLCAGMAEERQQPLIAGLQQHGKRLPREGQHEESRAKNKRDQGLKKQSIPHTQQG
jgi:hypothetical protein